MKHKHHIIPKHRGGTDDPSNIIEVSVEEHAELHLAEYLTYGLKEDWLAYRGLSGIIDTVECVREAQSIATSKANKIRVWSQETRKKHSRSQAKRGAKIYCIDLNKTWDCAKDAGEELGMNPKMIYRVASGERKSHKGLRFIRIGKVEPRKVK